MRALYARCSIISRNNIHSRFKLFARPCVYVEWQIPMQLWDFIFLINEGSSGSYPWKSFSSDYKWHFLFSGSQSFYMYQYCTGTFSKMNFPLSCSFIWRTVLHMTTSRIPHSQLSSWSLIDLWYPDTSHNSRFSPLIQSKSCTCGSSGP